MFLEIKTLCLSLLHNGEHYKFHLKSTQLLDTFKLLNATTPLVFSNLQTVYRLAKEYNVYVVFRKSDITKQLAEIKVWLLMKHLSKNSIDHRCGSCGYDTTQYFRNHKTT